MDEPRTALAREREPEQSERRSAPAAHPARRLATGAAAAVLGFALVVGVVRALTPPPEGFDMRPKVEYLAEHADRYDAVVIGSSRVFRGLVPAIVDRELAARGFELASFNFGVGGQESFESDHSLRWLLARCPERLRLVFLEVGGWEYAPESATNAFSRRWLEWHTRAGLRNVLEAIDRAELPPLEHARLAWEHVSLFVRRSVGYGIAPALLLRGPGAAELDFLDAEHLARHHGYQSLEERTGVAGRPRNMTPEQFRRLVATIRRTNTTEVGVRRLPLGALRRQAELARAAGVTLVHVALPHTVGSRQAALLAERGVLEHYLNFNDPARFPELFAFETRYSIDHLTAEGARLMSRAFAREVARLLRRLE